MPPTSHDPDPPAAADLEPAAVEPAGTRSALLDAAERLFAEHGIGAASVRAITQEAGANVAAVHYHFGSKEALARAVYSRRFGPLNAERLRRLDACEAAAGTGGPELRCLIEAFVGPSLDAVRDGSAGVLAGLIGRALSEPRGNGLEVLRAAFREIHERFVPALHRALPDLPADDLFWRFHFMVGAMAHTVQVVGMVGHATGPVALEIPADRDDRRLLRRLVDFVEAGLRAPADTEKPATRPAGRATEHAR